jgi:hypothetical protein
MRRNLPLCFIILLSLYFTSFFPEISAWLYDQKSYNRKIRTARTKFLKGIVLPFFSLEENYPYKTAIDEIADFGARSISLFITNYQEDIRSNYIYLNQRASEVEQLSDVIQYAHRRGLSVFVFPTLHIQHLGHKEWRGVLQPQNLELWWDNYFRMIRFYLHLSRENQVEIFSVGSELCSTESDYAHWSKLIQYSRRNFSGILMYSANWDHYHGISFMKDLDYIGMNAYFGLTDKDNPQLIELLTAWKPARKRIEEAYQLYSKPIIFTEIGYPSVDGANRNPWNYFATSHIDLQEQALCYEAFIKTWNPPPPYLHGVFFYNWWGAGGIGDRDYTPRGKPAAKLLSDWYNSLD